MITREEKLIKLSGVSEKLKSEFIGISDTIDTIIKSVTPWYITPELLERPVVISVWGLTGTGKTSVIRKLLEYLDVSEKALFFDCGAEENTDSSISDKITGFFDSGNSSVGAVLPMGASKETQELNGVFVFDEFQYSRTINEEGREVSKSSQRSIWNLMDSGILDVIQRPYEVKELITYTEELGYLTEELGRDLKISKGIWPDSVIPKVKETLDFYKSWDDEEDDKEGGDSKKTPILRKGKVTTIVNRLNSISRGLGYETAKKLESSGSLGEFYDILEGSVKVISQPKKLDCSRSLVFVIGNLDEAFTEHSDLDPDMDADVFAKITKKTCILDIKEALKKRFRTEQIGRLGNNMIIYPSLGKSDFYGVIDKELHRIFKKFKETSGISVSVSDKYRDFLYSEGVTPSQGVRPLLGVIGTTCLPVLSKILADPDQKSQVILDISGYTKTDVTISISYDTGKYFEYQEPLRVGGFRGKDSCKKIAAHAVHEVGHAIMMVHEKHELPEMILAQSSMGGGYTYGSLSDTDRLSAQCKADVDSEVRIALAGICSEHLFFEDQYCTLGCSQDYQDAWDELGKAVYKSGYFGTPYPFDCPDTQSGVSKGAPDRTTSEGFISASISARMASLYDDTTRILEHEKSLIKEVSKYLVEHRCMMTHEFSEYLEKYGSDVLKEKLKEPSGNYWIEKLV